VDNGKIVSVRWGGPALYAFVLVLLYLAAAYLGTTFIFLFSLFLLVPIGSILMIVVTAYFLKYHQDFSTDHPLKGEEVVYSIAVSKEGLLPSGRIRLNLVGTQQGMSLGLEDIELYPAANRRYAFSYTIHCPFRGVYTVGLESIELLGHLGWFSLFVHAWCRTFYVYPRVVDLHKSPFGDEGSSVSLPGLTRGGEEDYTLLESVEPYRAGMPIRHVAWKKFASMGEPALKRYDSSSRPGVTLVLDTRGSAERNEQALETEDCSVEILVALVKYFSEQDIPVDVFGDGMETFHFGGRDDDLFRKFHHATVGIFFQSRISPLQVVDELRLANRVIVSTVVFVTHLSDPEILAFCDRSASSIPAAAIVNLSGMTDFERERTNGSLAHLRERGAAVRSVQSSATLREDLER
jgi:uncharacterized protein (DUF58 family)